MTHKIIPLEEALDEASYGGKSSQLGACLRKGLPVPRGWALSVEFVDAVVNKNPEALTVLASFMKDLAEPLAVRSSAVGEDSSHTSFAGQYETILNCIGYENVFNAILTVRDSYQMHSVSSAYRAKLGIIHQPKMGVALQKMVVSDCSGVMFTRHPITKAEEIQIEASWGLGEVVVQGLVNPDYYRVNMDGTLVEKILGMKNVLIQGLPEGDVEQVPITDSLKLESFCLNEAQLQQLVVLANQCEDLFGPGRDIEWAIAKNVLYLLQCRAITR